MRATYAIPASMPPIRPQGVDRFRCHASRNVETAPPRAPNRPHHEPPEYRSDHDTYGTSKRAVFTIPLRVYRTAAMERLDDQPCAHPFRLNPRRCRCPSDVPTPHEPAAPRDDGDEYCGYCEVCGRLGHRRPFPGVLPIEGSWCDDHHRWIARLHPLGRHGILYWSLLGWCCVLVTVCAIV